MFIAAKYSVLTGRPFDLEVSPTMVEQNQSREIIWVHMVETVHSGIFQVESVAKLRLELSSLFSNPVLTLAEQTSQLPLI